MSQQAIRTVSYLSADWTDRPDNVRAVTTLRAGGVSQGGYAAFNLAAHVGDDLSSVLENRARVRQDLQLTSEPVWLEQIHGTAVYVATGQTSHLTPPLADACITREKGVVCAVLTADCLPVFFCNQSGTEVGVAHAGWRGLHAGIISDTIKAMWSPVDEILVSLGPAIGAQSFQVGGDVFNAFVEKNSANENAFIATSKTHYLCDIYRLAEIELQALGIDKIAGGGLCSYLDSDRFYSFRRQPVTGRMASLIWFS